jgi:hypothetical protein
MQPIDTIAVRAGSAVVTLYSRHSQTKRRFGSFLLSTAARDPLFGALVTQRTFRPSLSSPTPPQYCPLASANAANAGVLPC